MDDTDKKLDRLISTARDASKAESASAPFGFSTRVVAQAFAQPVATVLRAWESLSWRFLAFGCAALLLSAVAAGNLQASVEADIAASDAFAELFADALLP